MMHRRRVFRVSDRYDTPSLLARALVEHDWCTCNGFSVGHLLLLNDSTGPDGAQEYAVFDTRTRLQIESLTVSWMTRERLEAVIASLLVPGAGCRDMTSPIPSLEHPEGVCHACA